MPSMIVRSALGLAMSLAMSLATATAMAAAPNAVVVTPPCSDDSAACLTKVASLYLDALISHNGAALPLAPTIRRTENALTNAVGEHEVRESFAHTHMVEDKRNVRFYPDPGTGNVVVFFQIDVDLKETDAKSTTKAGNSEYKVAVTVPKGTYTVHEAERFKIVKGMITEIEIIAYVETGKGAGNGWPVSRPK